MWGMRKLSCLAIFLFLPVLVFSASLEMFHMDHPVYMEMDALYTIEGKASPLGSRPWTEIDVEHLLSAVSPRTEGGKRLKERLEGYIRPEKDFRGLFNAGFTPSMYVHSNPKDYGKAEDAFDIDIVNRPVADIALGLTYKEYIAGYMDFSLGFNFADASSGETDPRYRNAFSTNIPFASEGTISMNFPNRAYVAFGFDAFRIAGGRDRLSWGNGIMGNMMIGDTLPYHDYLSLSFTGSDWFSYQMLVSFFSHSENFSVEDDRVPLHGIRFFLGHRFEMRFFSGKVKFTVNESIMYQAEDGYLDPRLLNPLMFLHNLYMAGNANSLAVFELEYAPVNSVSLYLQFAIDDFAMPNEPQPGKDAGASSDGWGLMGGIRYAQALASGDYFYGNAEIVYTSPFLYHRADDTEKSAYDLYYVSSLRVQDGGVKSISRYLSFPFGSDAVAALLKFGYNDIDLYRVEGNIFFMAHGVIRKDSITTQYTGPASVPVAPSTSNPFDPAESGEVEYTFAFGGEGTVDPLSFLSIDAGAYCFFIWNKDNSPSPCSVDFQLSLGLTLKY